jgi:hypothetical protein
MPPFDASGFSPDAFGEAPRTDGHIPRIVLAGEPNSGKTTLANFLLRVPVLKADIVPNTPCPMLLRFSENAHLRVRQPDGSWSQRSLADLHLIKRGQARAIEVMLPLTLLHRIEILDLPGLASIAEIGTYKEWFALGDVHVWCAVASQAWRASEQAKWQALGASRGSSMLVLTHKDLLNESQYRDVADRASRETERFFSCWSAIATAQVNAAARNTRGEIVNQGAWVSTGAEDLMKKLIGLLQAVVPRGRDNAVQQIAPPRAASAPLPHPAELFGDWRQRILSRLKAGVPLRDTATIIASELQVYSDEIVVPWIAANPKAVPAGLDVAALIAPSTGEIVACLTPQPGDPCPFTPGDILNQIEAELADALRVGGQPV